MRDLSEIKVAPSVAFIENGVKIRQIARNLNQNPSVIKLVYDRHRVSGEYKTISEQGRKRKTTRGQDPVISEFFYDLRPRPPVRKPVLTRPYKTSRLNFVRRSLVMAA